MAGTSVLELDLAIATGFDNNVADDAVGSSFVLSGAIGLVVGTNSNNIPGALLADVLRPPTVFIAEIINEID